MSRDPPEIVRTNGSELGSKCMWLFLKTSFLGLIHLGPSNPAALCTIDLYMHIHLTAGNDPLSRYYLLRNDSLWVYPRR